VYEDIASTHGQATVVEPRSLDQCSGGRICVWQYSDFTGNWSSIIAQFPGQCEPVYGGGVSVYNNAAYTEKVYSGPNCTGAAYLVYPGATGVSDWTIYSVGGYP
jgi:hypothetical protein